MFQWCRARSSSLCISACFVSTVERSASRDTSIGGVNTITTRVKGAASERDPTCYSASSRARIPHEKLQWGNPCARAKIAGPGLATNRGPRGPSMVNRSVVTLRKHLRRQPMPRKPPRVELPGAAFRIQIARSRASSIGHRSWCYAAQQCRDCAPNTKCRKFHNAKKPKSSSAVAHKFARRAADQEFRYRSVRPRTRMIAETTAAIMGTCIRRQREYCGTARQNADSDGCWPSTGDFSDSGIAYSIGEPCNAASATDGQRRARNPELG